MSVKKVAVKSGSKKSRPSPTHPSWVDMIKECIAAYPEDARSGVSRPQIKKFVEEKYKIAFDPTQLSHLSKAIGSGAEKGTFVLPKGPSGRIKLPPKAARVTDTSASKENKPAKAVPKPATTKARPVKTATTKATTAKSATTKKPATKAKAVTTGRSTTKKPAAQTAARSSATKSAVTKAKAAPAPKKMLAGKKSIPAKKATPSSKRGTAKKAVTGSSPARGKVVAAKKPAAKKPAPRTSTSTTSRKKTTKK